MSKKDVREGREPIRSTAEYYKLNTKAIDDLVSADKGNSPEVSREELKKYGARRKFTLSQWLKAILIKFWFAGVICYFFIWGLGTYVANSLDLWLITAVALGFMTDLATNPILRLTEKNEGDSAAWMMFTKKKKFITLPLNVIYSCALMALCVYTYSLINHVVGVGVEPLLFGVVITAWDLILIQCKHLFQRILADAKAQAAQKK